VGSHEDEVQSNKIRSIVASTTGGVMTKEVGSITGDLEIATHPLAAKSIEVRVRYDGAEEWYTVKGSPIELGKAISLSPNQLHELHERVVRHLTTPGMVVEGNEQATSLVGFSPVASAE